MKFPRIPATFNWLAAAVLSATCGLFLVFNVLLPMTAKAEIPGKSLLTSTDPATLKSPALSSPEENLLPTYASDNLIQLAFLLDTSSSMDGLIEQAKSRLWGILNEIITARRDGTAPTVQVALYEYGNDRLPQGGNYIRQVVPLTSDVDEISEKLFGLTTNGGSEYCGAVIQRSLSDLQWTDDRQGVKLIYIAGNEPFTQGEVDPYKTISAARETGLVVNTIYCGNPEEGRRTGWYRGAMDGKGEYFHIDQNQATVYIASPYDDAIEVANQKLNKTYLPMGQAGERAMQKQQVQDANAAGYSKSNLASRAKYKASANYSNSHWDLVDAYEEDAKVVEKKEALPKELQGLKESEVVIRIQEMKELRNALQAEIKSLSELRDKHVAAEKKKAASSDENNLGDRINSSVKKRLKAKGYKF